MPAVASRLSQMPATEESIWPVTRRGRVLDFLITDHPCSWMHVPTFYIFHVSYNII